MKEDKYQHEPRGIMVLERKVLYDEEDIHYKTR